MAEDDSLARWSDVRGVGSSATEWMRVGKQQHGGSRLPFGASGGSRDAAVGDATSGQRCEGRRWGDPLRSQAGHGGGWDGMRRRATRARCVDSFSGCLVRAHISRASSVQQLAAAVEENAPSCPRPRRIAAASQRPLETTRLPLRAGVAGTVAPSSAPSRAAQGRPRAIGTRCLFTSDPDQPRHTHTTAAAGHHPDTPGHIVMFAPWPGPPPSPWLPTDEPISSCSCKSKGGAVGNGPHRHRDTLYVSAL